MESTINSITFLQGWRSLPVELKLHILQFLVPSNRTYRSISFSKGVDTKRSCSHDHDFDNLILPLLSCAEICNLVKEMFYGQNLILIRNYPVAPHLRYPPKTINCHIKRLTVIFTFKTREFDFVRKLGGGQLGFSGLQNVEIRFNTQNTQDDEDVALVADAVAKFAAVKMSVPCLKLRLLYYYTRPRTLAEANEAQMRTSMYSSLLEKISIIDDEGTMELPDEKVFTEDEEDGYRLLRMFKICQRLL